MDTPLSRLLRVRLLTIGLAVTLSGAAVLLSLPLAIPAAAANAHALASSDLSRSPEGGTPPARLHCACGIIESTRELSGPVLGSHRGEVDGTPVRNYEITIRLKDGSMRVLTDPNSAKWRYGERISIIAGLE